MHKKTLLPATLFALLGTGSVHAADNSALAERLLYCAAAYENAAELVLDNPTKLITNAKASTRAAVMVSSKTFVAEHVEGAVKTFKDEAREAARAGEVEGQKFVETKLAECKGLMEKNRDAIYSAMEDGKAPAKP